MVSILIYSFLISGGKPLSKISVVMKNSFLIFFAISFFGYSIMWILSISVIPASFAVKAIASFIPHTIAWLGIGPTDRNSVEKLLNINQFLTYLGASFGFLAAFIVYKHSMKKI